MVQKLSRQQLQQFLPNHEAIKAFESLFEYVTQTGPDTTGDIQSILATLAVPTVAINRIAARLDELEQKQARPTAYGDILARLEVLEQQVAKRAGNGDILQRLQNLESIVGV